MGANTKIEWAHHTFNPVVGCTPVSEGCRNCYAAAHALRFADQPRSVFAGLASMRGSGCRKCGGDGTTADTRDQLKAAWNKMHERIPL